MTDIAQEYLTQEGLALKLGIAGDRTRIATLRRKTYEGKIPGAIMVLGRWHYRIIDIEKALIGGRL